MRAKAAERNDIQGLKFLQGDCFVPLNLLLKKEVNMRVILDPPRFAGQGID